MLRIENITFNYPGRRKPTYSGFSLEMREAGVYGLLGPNGAGKSTLLYLIAGLLNASCGRVTLNGEDTRRRLPSTLSEIFLVPEEFNLPAMSADEYARLNGRLYPRYDHDAFGRNLEHFGIDVHDNLSKMSMGQRKKAFIAFALACNTRMLLMDEPTNGLDIPGKSQFRRLIAEQMSDERIIIISTHQVRDIDRILDHIVIVSEGGKLLLDASCYDITRVFRFGFTTDCNEAARALFAIPTIGGSAVITPATAGDESDSDINLEVLFEYATAKGSSIGQYIGNKSLS